MAGRLRSKLQLTVYVLLIVALSQRLAAGKEASPLPDWLPVDPAELALKDCAGDPGAPAMVLYRQEITDDVNQTLTVYLRIKVFKEEGRKYADVEIPYSEKLYEIAGLRARTIHPDGRAVDFQGETYDRIVVRAGKAKVQVKSFSLPDVELGSIFEYMYQMHWEGKLPDVFVNPGRYVIERPALFPTARWTISHELFTRRANFQFRPNPSPQIIWCGQGGASARNATRQLDGSFLLNVENIPAAVTEEFMPPSKVALPTIAFFYSAGYAGGPEDFWQSYADYRSEAVEAFIGKPEWVEKVVEETTSASDSPEMKLRKLYGRAQQIRMLAFEHSRAEKERQKENLKENKTVRDVLQRGYAEGAEVNLLFAAMCRAAGFPAHILLLEQRNRAYFSIDFTDFNLLTANVVRVQVGSKDYILDPATLYCPFDLLPWEESAAGGIALLPGEKASKSNGAPRYTGKSDRIVVTPPPHASDAVTARNATLTLAPDGSPERKAGHCDAGTGCSATPARSPRRG